MTQARPAKTRPDAERAVSILDYRPDLATDYLNFADELLRRLGMEEPRRRVQALLNGAVGTRVLQ